MGKAVGGLPKEEFHQFRPTFERVSERTLVGPIHLGRLMEVVHIRVVGRGACLRFTSRGSEVVGRPSSVTALDRQHQFSLLSMAQANSG